MGRCCRPPLAQWQQTLSELQANLDHDNLRRSSQQVSDVDAQIHRYLNWFAEFDAFPARLAAFKKQQQTLSALPNDVGRPYADQATQLMATAEKQFADHDPTFIESLDGVDQAIAAGQQAGRAEQDRLAAAEARRRLMRNSAAATLFVVAVAVVVVLIVLNRRRAATKRNVLAAYTERQRSVRGEMDRVVRLFQRSGEILGSRDKVQQRGYEGTTKQLCHQTFDTVDELLIMSNEVDRVMDEASDLIQPEYWYGRLINLFSASRYQQGLNRISGEPLVFHENQGIPAILRPDATAEQATGEPSLDRSDGGQSRDSISLNFETVFAAFRERTLSAANTLDRIESSLLEASDQLQALQDRIDEATAIEKTISEQAVDDQFFAVPDFFETLLPSIQADHDEADDLIATDPAQVVDVQIPRAVHKLDDAMALTDAIETARSEVFPLFDQHAPRLKQAGFETQWIETAVTTLGDHANQLFRLAAEHRVSEEAADLHASVWELGNRVANCAELAEDLQANHEPEIDNLRDTVDRAGQEIAGRLQQPVRNVLCETNADPHRLLESTRELLVAARAALQHGDFDAANTASETICDQVTEGHDIVSKSLAILETFAEQRADVVEQTRQLQNQLPQFQQTVSRAETQYACAALRLQAGNPSCPDEHATTSSRLDEAGEFLTAADQALRDAAEWFQSGQAIAS